MLQHKMVVSGPSQHSLQRMHYKVQRFVPVVATVLSILSPALCSPEDYPVLVFWACLASTSLSSNPSTAGLPRNGRSSYSISTRHGEAPLQYLPIFTYYRGDR